MTGQPGETVDPAPAGKSRRTEAERDRVISALGIERVGWLRNDGFLCRPPCEKDHEGTLWEPVYRLADRATSLRQGNAATSSVSGSDVEQDS